MKNQKIYIHSYYLPSSKIQHLKDLLSGPIILATQNVVPGPASLAPPGTVSEMQGLRPHPKPADSGSVL